MAVATRDLAHWGCENAGRRSAAVMKAPSQPAHVVDRPALRQKLDAVVDHDIALIVAPAGAGKSVLLAQWAETRPELQFVWIEIVTSDDDPVRFGRRLLRGLAEVDRRFDDVSPLASVHGEGLGDAFLDDLAMQMKDLPEVIVVLEDLHHLSNAALIGDLARLADLLPRNVHLVLSSRADLPIAWSRQRMRLDVTEIRQADLAFDKTDSAELLERITGHSLSQDSVTALVNRTEGWAAGLQLAGMTLRLHEDPVGFVTQFSGTDRLVADYLSEEVLQAQSSDRRALLLQMSVPDAMSADLIGSLTGARNVQGVLEELERESMFLVPLDSTREWYRFHHLFRDLLRFRLRAEDPELEVQLLHKAAAWHLHHGETDLAVECLLSARDWDAALELILSRGSEVFERGEMSTAIRWLSTIPDVARIDRHEVNLLLGMLQGTEGQGAAAEDTVRRVRAHPGATRGEAACAQTFLASLVQFRANHQLSIDMAEEALAMLDDLTDEPMPTVMNLADVESLRTMALVSGGRAHFLAGHLADARSWLKRGLASTGSAYSVWRICGLGSSALVEAWSGHTERAETLADEALAIAQSVGILGHPSTADAYLAITLAALERGEPRRAAISLHEGTLRAEANRRTQLSWVAHLGLALLREAEGEFDQSAAVLTTSHHPAGPPPPVVDERLRALEIRLLRLRGRCAEASRVSERVSWDSPALRFEQIAVALSTGQPDRARKFMDSSAGPESDNPAADLRAEIELAWLSSAEGSSDAAHQHLVHALELGARHCLVEIFVQTGPAVLQLVAGIRGVPAAFRDAILGRSRQLTSPVSGEELVEPLTDRELEILSYLPSRFTNSEMAQRCYVSVNTIKTHMTHIYRKLDVANRNAAIRRAQEIGLL
jgi:LuxR family transcriptional regulator, maltose regulon positive regulatory protein